jgi:hypothetical protein
MAIARTQGSLSLTDLISNLDREIVIVGVCVNY